MLDEAQRLVIYDSPAVGPYRAPIGFQLAAFDAYSQSRGKLAHVKATMRHLVKTQTKQVPASDLERIGLPSSLLWGRHDRAVPLGVGEWAGSRLGWPMQVIEDAGHVPRIEQPEASSAPSQIQPASRGEART